MRKNLIFYRTEIHRLTGKVRCTATQIYTLFLLWTFIQCERYWQHFCHRSIINKCRKKKEEDGFLLCIYWDSCRQLLIPFRLSTFFFLAYIFLHFLLRQLFLFLSLILLIVHIKYARYVLLILKKTSWLNKRINRPLQSSLRTFSGV